jgi:predicted amidohydrolase YtcJ
MTRYLLAALLGLVSLTCCTTQEAKMPAQTILINGQIWTGVTGQEPKQAMAFAKDQILAVGSNAEVEDYRVESTTIVDLGGKFVMPGLIDSHTHFLEGGFSLLNINLRPAADEREFAALIRDHAAALPAGEWITGGGWDHESWPSHQLPARQLIDPVTPQTPVFVDRLDGHMALANSLALKLAGVTRDTPNPPGGEIVRDRRGEPTGILRDGAMNLVSRVIPVPEPADRERAAQAALEEARRLGVTTVVNMGGLDDIAVFQSLLDRQMLTVRVYAATPLPDWQQLGEIAREKGGGYLMVGAVKGFMDGSLGSTTAWFFDPYVDAPGSTGLPAPMYFPEGNLVRLVQEADLAGLHVVVHAIGDRANEELLEIYEQTAKANGRRDRRFRIEHAQHLAPHSLERFAALGVIASMQPYHLIDDGRWAEKRIGAERLKGTYAFRSLIDKGTVVAFGTDWPVAPLNPLLGVYAAVTRRTLDDQHSSGWIPEQKISVEEALTCYTRNSAHGIFMEDSLGTLEPGKQADMIVLSDSPLEVDAVEIKDIVVLQTYVGGKRVYAGRSTN